MVTDGQNPARFANSAWGSQVFNPRFILFTRGASSENWFASRIPHRGSWVVEGTLTVVESSEIFRPSNHAGSNYIMLVSVPRPCDALCMRSWKLKRMTTMPQLHRRSWKLMMILSTFQWFSDQAPRSLVLTQASTRIFAASDVAMGKSKRSARSPSVEQQDRIHFPSNAEH